VFPTHLGGMYSRGYDANWVTQWRKKSGCAEHVRFHDLRHTCGSHLVMGTWGRPFTLMEVRDWLGHSDIKTTQRYARLAPDALKNLVSDLE
jgi:integrase